MKFSPAQMAAITSRNENVILSASAGSGKTSVLVERLCSLVLEDHVSISNILAMTFTEDAAREMKARLKSRLAKAGQDEWAKNQLALLEDASISTIDSFCYSLVKEFYYKVPISWTMANHVENGPRNKLAFQTAMEEAMASLEPERMARLRLFFEGPAGPDEALQDALSAFLDLAASKADPEGWMESCRSIQPETETHFLEFFKVRIEAMADIAQFFYSAAEREAFTKIAQQEALLQELEGRQAWLEQCKLALEEGYGPFRQAFLEGFERVARLPGTFNKHSYKKEQARSRALEKDIYENLHPLTFFEADEKERQADVDAFIDLARSVRTGFARQKRYMQIIDFQDMEHFALQLLQDPMVQEEVRSRYASILVDEFQDTNDLQEAIIASFARENNCFRVGDIKQSIYGFRQARPQIMRRHMETDTLLYLRENYRSTKTLVDFANDFFSKILPGFSDGDIAVPGTEAQKTGIQKPVRFLYTEYGMDPGEETLVQKKKRHNRYRYDLVAQDILEQAGRGMDYRSICILTRGHSQQEELKEALEAWGIPVIAEIDHGFYSNQAVQVVLSVLSVMADERDDISAVAMLCSAMGGLSHGVLSNALASRPEGISVLYWLKDSPLLENWNRIKGWKDLPVPELLVKLYGWKDWYETATTAQDKTNLDLLLEMAGQQPDMDLRTFVEVANSQSSLDKTAEASLYGKEENVVKIKTMHHSKGLQYPLVYVLSRQRETDRDNALAVRSDADLGLAFQGRDKGGRLSWKSRSQLAFQDKAWPERMAEEMRLLYVACTRAEQELVIVDTIESLEPFLSPLELSHMLAGNSYTQWLLHTFAGKPDSPLLLDCKTELKDRPKAKKAFRPGFSKGRYSLPVQEIRSKTASAAKKKNVWGPIRKNPNRGTERGTLFHEMAARLPFPYQKADIEAFARSRKADWTSRDTEQLMALNANADYQKWMAETHVFEESYNTFVDGDLTHGFMDLVVYEPDRTVIIDFKSDYVNEIEELEAKYRGQLEVYRAAMEKIRPDVPVVTAIYSFHFGKLWEIV